MFKLLTALILCAATAAFATPLRRDTLTDRSSGESIATGLVVKGPIESNANRQTVTVAYCSNLANAGTIYMAGPTGPNIASVDAYARAVGDATCDARGNATEGTADEILSAELAARPVGMLCCVESSLTGSATFTLRASTANVTGANYGTTQTSSGVITVGCTVASGGALCCRPPNAALSEIAASAPIDVMAVTTANDSAKGGLCRVTFELP